MTTHLTIWLAVRSLLAAALLLPPVWVIGIRAQLDVRRQQGRRLRTDLARLRTRLRALGSWRSAPAGTGESKHPSRPPVVDGRGASHSPTTALVGVHRVRRHG